MHGFSFARLATAAALLGALADLPYGYYTLMRVLCCSVAGYGVFLSVKREKPGWGWAFVATAVLFNPVAPIHLDRETWAVVDVAVAALMVFSLCDKSLVESPAAASLPAYTPTPSEPAPVPEESPAPKQNAEQPKPSSITTPEVERATLAFEQWLRDGDPKPEKPQHDPDAL
jgi:hypothetical protein